MTRVPSIGGLPVTRSTLTAYPDGLRTIQLMSDLHLGAANCDEELIQDELQDAMVSGSDVWIGGDVVDLILPGDRKRYTPDAVTPALQGRRDLLNAQVEYAVKLLYPYREIIKGLCPGNHETAVEKHHAFDPTREIVRQLNQDLPKSQKIKYMGYSGYIVYDIQDEHRHSKGRYVIWYTHGAGGAKNTPQALAKLVSKGSIFAADLYWTGHTHTRGQCSELMIHCPQTGHAPRYVDLRFVLTGSYAHTYGGQPLEHVEANGRVSNYAADAAMKPHGLGGARVLLHFSKPGYPSRVEVVQ